MDVTRRIRDVEKKVQTARRNGPPYIQKALDAHARFFRDASLGNVQLIAWEKRLVALQTSISQLAKE